MLKIELSIITGMDIYLSMRKFPEENKREIQALFDIYPITKEFPKEELRHHPYIADDDSD